MDEYAILSHTWAHSSKDKELEYQDIQTLVHENPSYNANSFQESGSFKVDGARTIAWEMGINWIWIDSCCINKADIQEHTEAINSMYQWYTRSHVCLVYLQDLYSENLRDRQSESCRWFRRGWTLQELIAPPKVMFYNKNWQCCGSKNGYGIRDEYDREKDLSSRIATLSLVDERLLKQHESTQIRRILSSTSASRKMYWASKRKTTKLEDMAYCLIGIFDIHHMYLKLGEGEGAFTRLQEEIIKQTSDPTLFAWLAKNPSSCNPENLLLSDDIKGENGLFPFDESLHGIFACHPGEFELSRDIESTQHVMYNHEITLTSRGIKFKTPLLPDVPRTSSETGPCFPLIMPIDCKDGRSGRHLGIKLRWVGGDIYARTNIQEPTYLPQGLLFPSQDEVFVVQRIHRVRDCIASLHRNSIQLPAMVGKHLRRGVVSPGSLWSEEHQLFMTSGKRFPVGLAAYTVLEEQSTTVALIFGLDYKEEPWSCLIGPDSQLAPSNRELRGTYIDRIWHDAGQMQTRSITFQVGTILITVEGGIKPAHYEPGDEPSFYLDLEVLSSTIPGHASRETTRADSTIANISGPIMADEASSLFARTLVPRRRNVGTTSFYLPNNQSNTHGAATTPDKAKFLKYLQQKG